MEDLATNDSGVSLGIIIMKKLVDCQLSSFKAKWTVFGMVGSADGLKISARMRAVSVSQFYNNV